MNMESSDAAASVVARGLHSSMLNLISSALCDPTKARQTLGWNPQKTPFDQLVSIMVKHYMEKVAAEHVASVMRTNLAEYLEKGVVK